MDKPYSEKSWPSPDGLALHFRDYPSQVPGTGTRPPVLCLHGLTRNGRDFEHLALHLSAAGWRVLAPDMRGRGNSDYATDSATYTVPVYVADVLALLEQEEIDRFVAIGTSMGGLMTMMLATLVPERLAGVVLNDIGPVVESEGLDKIKTYIGQGRSFATWMHAARALEEVHGQSHPTFDTEDWLAMAKRGMTVCSNGRIAFDYDMKIADPILDPDGEAAAVPPDLWPAYEALAGRPVLLVRGDDSTLFSTDTFAEMKRRIPQATTVTVPDTGHAPTLDEPETRAAIDALLAAIA
ncbi:MAG: alpha/beta hydrolase [Alphaproteobacteria bacterium]|nr:alpha/beta hydrolase [Alphaproteobacteria bacterium]